MARKTPNNRNLLSPNGFQLLIARLPNLEFFIQDIEIPGIESPEVSQPTPLVEIKHHADKLKFTPLRVFFSLDEDMKAWEELYKWKLGLAYPNSTQEHKDLKEGRTLPPDTLYSDLTIIIETNQHNPNLRFIFKDAFPTDITPFRFSSRSDTVKPLEFSATFSYTTFSFERIKND